jgi:hypothetical protein
MSDYRHSSVNHLASYVEGKVYTNGMEKLLSLLKHNLGGTYVSIRAILLVSLR